MYIPNICFCSCGGAEANMEAVKGSWPCTWTAGCKLIKHCLKIKFQFIIRCSFKYPTFHNPAQIMPTLSETWKKLQLSQFNQILLVIAEWCWRSVSIAPLGSKHKENSDYWATGKHEVTNTGLQTVPGELKTYLKSQDYNSAATMQSLNSRITKTTINHKCPPPCSAKKQQQNKPSRSMDQFLKLHTCCIATCGCVLRCCWGLRTPAAYLYCGTVRTDGVAAVAAAAGRGPIVCVDVLAEKT